MYTLTWDSFPLSRITSFPVAGDSSSYMTGNGNICEDDSLSLGIQLMHLFVTASTNLLNNCSASSKSNLTMASSSSSSYPYSSRGLIDDDIASDSGSIRSADREGEDVL